MSAVWEAWASSSSSNEDIDNKEEQKNWDSNQQRNIWRKKEVGDEERRLKKKSQKGEPQLDTAPVIDTVWIQQYVFVSPFSTIVCAVRLLHVHAILYFDQTTLLFQSLSFPWERF